MSTTPPATPAAPQAPAAAEPGTPAATPTATSPAAETATPEAPKPGDPADAFKSEESKNAVLADLAKERDARQALETKLAAFETSNETRNKALAEALGLAEAPKSEDLAETVRGLQQQIEASNLEALKLRIAANPGDDAEGNPLPAIPAEYHNLLTETDPEKLKAQAAMVGALVAAKTAADGTPEFQANSGQGQGGGTPDADALAEAEYAKFYPTPK